MKSRRDFVITRANPKTWDVSKKEREKHQCHRNEFLPRRKIRGDERRKKIATARIYKVSSFPETESLNIARQRKNKA